MLVVHAKRKGKKTDSRSSVSWLRSRPPASDKLGTAFLYIVIRGIDDSRNAEKWCACVADVNIRADRVWLLLVTAAVVVTFGTEKANLAEALLALFFSWPDKRADSHGIVLESRGLDVALNLKSQQQG